MASKLVTKIVLPCLALAAIAAPACWAEGEENLVIENGRSVSIEYTLRLNDGTTVDTNVGQDPLTYTQGSSEILPALEEALAGHAVGDTKEVNLSAEQGYGPVNLEAYQEVELDMVPEDSRTVGTMLVASAPDGQQQPIKVHEVMDETIVLDFNHPLAGEALNFDIKILAIQ
jgi:FKBP-type peptidyl-prolyl cis-trans isomerase SlyD